MGLNLGQLRTALKRYGFDDDDPIDLWLNAAYHEFETAAEWPWREVSEIGTMPAGDSVVTVQGDFSKIVFVRNNTTGEMLEYRDNRRFNREIEDLHQPGVPCYYTIMGLNVLQLWPVTTSDFEIYVLALAALREELNDNLDIPAIPDAYHYGLVYGAASIGLEAENEEDRSTVARAKFDSAIDRCRVQYSIREEGEAHQVEDSQGYLGSY